MNLLSPEYLEKHFLPLRTWWDRNPDRTENDFRDLDEPRGIDPEYVRMTPQEESEYLDSLTEDSIY